MSRWRSGIASAAVTAVALTAGATGAAAQSASATLQVSANVSRNCTITTTPLAFGAYDPVVANVTNPLDGVGSVVIACTQGTTSTIGLSVGANAQGSVRRLSDGATAYLTYEMYQDGTRTVLWGDSGAERLDAGTAPSRDPRTFTVYGRVAQGQDVPVGVYADSVVATVNF